MFLEYLCHLINRGSARPPQVHWVVKANIHRIMLGAGETKMNRPYPQGAHGWRANHPASNGTKLDKENNKEISGSGEGLWGILGMCTFVTT